MLLLTFILKKLVFFYLILTQGFENKWLVRALLLIKFIIINRILKHIVFFSGAFLCCKAILVKRGQIQVAWINLRTKKWLQFKGSLDNYASSVGGGNGHKFNPKPGEGQSPSKSVESEILSFTNNNLLKLWPLATHLTSTCNNNVL